MSERIFREMPPVDPELVEALKKLHDESEQLTRAYIQPEHNLSAHLGHHYGPVHPNIMPHTPVEKERS